MKNTIRTALVTIKALANRAEQDMMYSQLISLNNKLVLPAVP